MPFRLPPAQREYIACRLRQIAVWIERGKNILPANLEPATKRLHKPQSLGRPESIVLVFRCDQLAVAPDRDSVGAPIAAQRPTRKRLSRIPFPLAVVQQAARRNPLAQPLNQSHAARSLHRPQGCDVPLRALGFVNADVGRLPAHGQPRVVGLQIRVDPVRDLPYPVPVRLGKWLGKPPRIVHPAN